MNQAEEINIPVCEECLESRKYKRILARFDLGKDPEIIRRRASRVNVCYICNKLKSDCMDVTFKRVGCKETLV